MSIFINGELLDSRESSRYVQSSVSFRVGSFYDYRYPFIGCIGSIMLYNTALTGMEIADLARYRNIQIDANAEQLFIKLRPGVLSERIRQTTHLLGVSSVETEKLLEV